MTDLAMDYLGLDALLSGAELAWRDTSVSSSTRIRPDIRKWYEQAPFPAELAPGMGRLGLLGTHLSGYGCPGRSAVEYGLAALEVEAGDSGLRTFVSVQGSLAMTAIHRFGTEAQKQRWLPPMAAGEVIGCFGLTEPKAGSDPGSMTTTARRDGGGWVIDGAKRWIGLASIAGIAIIWARTDDGVRGFLVPTDTPGFTATPIEPKLAMRASIQCDIALDGVRVPADAILPGAAGLGGPFACLNEARYGIIWGAMGAARDAYEVALGYALERRQFGKPIASFQLTQEKLVNMVLEIQEGAAGRVAHRPDEGRRNAGPRAALVRKAEQRPDRDRHRPPGPDHPRRQWRGAGVLPDAAREQPGGRAHLRGHRRGAHPDHGPGHHRHLRFQLKDPRLAGQSLFFDPWHDGLPQLCVRLQGEPGLAGLDAGRVSSMSCRYSA